MWGIVFAMFYIIIIATIVGAYYYKTNKLKKAHLEKVTAFFIDIDILKQDYFTKPLEERIKLNYQEVFDFFSKLQYSKLKNPKLDEFMNIFARLSDCIKEWNALYIENELVKHKELFDNIDGKSLDNQQRKAVVVDEINNLVLAGAGSGKTLTICGKVKYLVETKNIKPNEILLISFTTKAAEEMYQRISKRLSIDVEAKTFHRLGLGIITKDEYSARD